MVFRWYSRPTVPRPVKPRDFDFLSVPLAVPPSSHPSQVRRSVRARSKITIEIRARAGEADYAEFNSRRLRKKLEKMVCTASIMQVAAGMTRRRLPA